MLLGKAVKEECQNAKAMGIGFVKAKVAKIAEDEEHNLTVRVELVEEDGRVEERVHDLVVPLHLEWSRDAIHRSLSR